MKNENGSELPGGAADPEQQRGGDARVQFIEGDGGDEVTAGGWFERKMLAVADSVACSGDGKVKLWCFDKLTAAVGLAIVWGLLYVNSPPGMMSVPQGSLSSIVVLYVVATVAGQLITKIGGLPPLLGMMLAAIFLQNAGLYHVDGWCVQLVSLMRDAALTVILVKGGLELNAGELLRLSGVVARLTLLPCIAEAVAAGVAAHYILPNFSWEWGLALGFTLSAVSPAVLVPSLFRLKCLGYGEIKGVNTLLIAASSLDDTVSISAFGILLGVLFSNGSLTSKITQGPIDVSIGTLLGIIWGLFLIFVPAEPTTKIYKNQESEDENIKKLQIERSLTAKRSLLLGFGGFLAVTGSAWYGFPGAGPLACIISAFVAGTGWRRRLKKQTPDNPVILNDGEEITDDAENPVVEVFENAWVGLQPVLFAFIGTELKFELLQSGGKVFSGLIILAFGLVIRLIVTTCSVAGSGFSPKEVLFINIAWLPKATVQAALAPVALFNAMKLGTPQDVECASQLVTIAVISILLTAPVGAFGIQLFGPRLLPKSR